MKFPPQLATMKPGMRSVLDHVPFSAQAYVISCLAREKRQPIVHIVPQDKDATSLAALCQFFCPELPVYYLPAWDTLPYDRVSPASAILSQRLATLGQLATLPAHTPYILLTTLNAASQKLPPKQVIAAANFRIEKGRALHRDRLIEFLTANGYQRASKVMEAGEYAVRGSLMDIFPAGAEEAIRIDLFGDEVESLKRFDPLTQLSAQALDSITLRPVSEVLLQAQTIDCFRANYRELFGAITKEDPLYEAISAGRSYAGMEHWLPLFYERMDTLADYTPGAILSEDYRIAALYEERTADIADYYSARIAHQHAKDGVSYHPIPPEKLFLDPVIFDAVFQGHSRVELTPFATKTSISLGLQSSPQLFQRTQDEHPLEVVKRFLTQSKKTVILAAASPGSAERIKKMLELPNIMPCETHALATSYPIALAVLAVEQGFETESFLLLTEQDMFGERILRTQKKKRTAEAFMQEAASFLEGELIVHREHGIGKFEGLVTVEVGSTRHDCLKLIYDGGDKLFLPVENIDMVSRYGTAEETIALDKLGGVAWQKRKSALKKRLKMAAEALIKVAAERAARPAPAMLANTGAYDEFCARFAYTETDDQLQAIDDVKTDLASGHVMDRLICGDVGFGKTEVAMRAAFIAAHAGYQVAIIAPTTLLARQHFRTFSERFHGLPFQVRMLSRLTSAKDAAETKKLLPEGKVDIVIGTHALLAAGIAFKNLGLVIVDEEQHFGVAQKEKLKQLKSDIHVLTLSATPIPRTLQMSLVGVRELSLITTPPIDRLAVRTYVMPYDPVIVREALLREYHRGGKSFIVTPRVKYMAELHSKLHTLVPEIKIATAHGQMAATQLDRTMNDFYDGKHDALLSTAIIESGIDIPTANTMIIDRPQLFGLAQLYQLRGRVGRSKTRAYAYFTLPHHHLLSRDAERRLEVMQQLDSLGAGFQLASHDMDIRGFGNLLGEEQSGHIKEVGIELYQAMLEEAITDLRRKRSPEMVATAAEDWSPQINLGMSVLIPESYIEDLSLRLSLYRRAAALDSHEALESFAAELTDRFGTPPTEVEHLLAVLAIKITCKQAGISRIDAGPKGTVLAFKDNRFAAPEALLTHLAKNMNRLKLRADQTLLLQTASANESERLTTARTIANEILSLLPAANEKAA